MSSFTLCRSYALRARRECHYLTVGARKCSTGKPRKLWHRSQRSFIVSKMIEAAMSVRFLPYYTLRACAPKRCPLWRKRYVVRRRSASNPAVAPKISAAPIEISPAGCIPPLDGSSSTAAPSFAGRTTLVQEITGGTGSSSTLL